MCVKVHVTLATELRVDFAGSKCAKTSNEHILQQVANVASLRVPQKKIRC